MRCEDKNKMSKYSGGGISGELILYLLFFVTANLLDWFTVFTNMKDPYQYHIILSVYILVIVFVKVLTKKDILKTCFITDRYDMIPFVLLSILAIIRIAIPDASYDTFNYHLFWQDSFGSNIIYEDFFPTRVINSLFFCLGDRTFYLFRKFWGYRAGVLLTLFAVLLIYQQGRRFISALYSAITGKAIEELDQKEKIWIAAGAFLCVAAEQILIELDTYYVDLLAIPFLIEALFRLFFTDKQCDTDFLLLGVMAGVCMCIKPSNFVWIVLILFYYGYQFWRTTQWKYWIFGIIFAILVCCPYFCLSYRFTGNPVFPYFNTIFRSEWFFEMGVDTYSGIKALFGPSTVKEYLFWPFYMTFQADKIHFSDYQRYSGRIFAALIFSVAFLICFQRNKKHLFRKISGCFVLCYVLYLTLLNGHLRYALLLEWFAGIILITAGIYLWRTKNRWIGAAMTIIILLPVAFSIKWLWHYTFDSAAYVTEQSLFENKDNWLNNAKYLFHDYGKQKIEIADAAGFIVFDTNGSMMSMLDVDVPIVNIKSGALTAAAKKRCEIVRNDMQEKGTIYSLSKPNKLKQLMKEIQSGGYYASAIKTVKLPKISNAKSVCYLVSLKEGNKKTDVYENQELQKEIIIDAQTIKGKKLNIFVGRKWGDVASDSETTIEILTDKQEAVKVSFDSAGNFFQYELQVQDNIEQPVKIKLDSKYFLNKWMVVSYE